MFSRQAVHQLLRIAALALPLCGGTARAQLPHPGGTCDPNIQSCASGTTPPGAGGGTCSPATSGATCGGGGPATLGAASGINVGAGNPINIITGNKYQRETDMPALPGVLGLEIVRHYNSSLSRPNHSTGLVGRGWRLSYETELYPRTRTIQIVQADGARVTFERDARTPSLCASANPADGDVRVLPSPRGDQYVWTWTTGRKLRFDSAGKLTQIAEPTGEFVSLQYDRKGLLMTVTDPQGRQLRLNYLDQKAARTGDRFRGVQSMDSPVGRYSYAYGSARPPHATLEPAFLLANLVRVDMPVEDGDGPAYRIYHYEDANFPTLLTGISIGERSDDGKPVVQRVATYGYDANGKAVMTVHGVPARFRLGSDGKPVRPAAVIEGTGIEQVTLDTGTPGLTILHNSLGQRTVYHHAVIAGHHRLLDARGPGCSSCGATNVRYRYDSLGRLVETTRLDAGGRPWSGLRSTLDAYGRPLRVDRIGYRDGQPAPPRWQWRYVYGPGPAPAPLLIARPSVVPGGAVVTRVRYNDRGQPLTVSETGWVPTVDGLTAAGAVTRTLRYGYRLINNRSVLSEIDGPLPNGPGGGPADSDVTRIEYDARGDFAVRVTAPGDIGSEVLARDQALRPSQIRSVDGALTLLATVRNNRNGQPVSIDVQAGGQHRRTRYRYGADGRLLAMIRPGDVSTTFVRDVAGRVVRRDLPDGTRLALDYDAESRPARLAQLGGTPSATRYAYDDGDDAPGRLSAITDELGLVARYRHDARGQLVAIDNALGNVSRFRLDENGWMAQRTDAADSTDAATIGLTHDEAGHPTRVLAANGVATQRRYDDFGRKVYEYDPDRGVTLFRYDAAGRLSARIDETLGTTRYAHDHAGRLVTVGIDRDPALVRYRHSGGRVSEVLASTDGDPRHVVERTLFQSDAWGRVTRETRWIARVDQGTGPGLVFVTRHGYDEAGRLVSRTLPDGHVLRYRYSSGNSAKAPGIQRAWKLDAILFDNTVVVSGIERTSRGRLTAYTMGNGIRQRFELDHRRRTTVVETIAPIPPQSLWSKIVSWFPSVDTSSPSPVYRQHNSYDVADRLTRLERRFDSNQAGVTSNVRTEIYGYDHLGRLARINSGDGMIRQFRYDKNGNRISETGTLSPSSENYNKNYHYGPNNNWLLAATHVQPATTDSARLRPAPQESMDTVWLYHSTGVPLAQLAINGIRPILRSQRVIYNRAKRPVAVYDDAGNVLARYYYNSLGERIAKSTYPLQENTFKTSYHAHKEKKQTIYSLYHEQQLVAETDVDGHIAAHYIYLYGKPVAKIEMTPNRSIIHRLWAAVKRRVAIGSLPVDGVGHIYAIHTDHLGTPQFVTDERRQIAWHAKTNAFGEASIQFAALRSKGNAFEMRLRLPGQVFDPETGLHQNYYRDYAPQLGRYLIPDPFESRIGENPYTYVENNPLTNIDPLGLYQIDVHYYMTYFLAITAGVDKNTARLIALATQYIDDNPVTQPMLPGESLWDKLGSAFINQPALERYHFVQEGYDPNRTAAEGLYKFAFSGDLQSYVDRRVQDPSNPQLDRLLAASNFAKTDPNANCASSAQLFGEFLHTFEDTFAHRDNQNNPYSAQLFSLGTGHFTGGENPDYTFNHDAPCCLGIGPWNVNEARTRRMEEEVFEKMKTFSKPGNTQYSLAAISYTLHSFNQFKASDKDDNFIEKIEILNGALKSLGYKDVNVSMKSGEDRYIQDEAKSNRSKALGKLEPSDYIGTILPQGTEPLPQKK